MRTKTVIGRVFFVLAGAALAACGGGGDGSSSTSVTQVAPTENKLITDPEGGVYPVNEIVLSLVDSATMSDAEDLATLVGGTIVSSSTITNIYVLEVPTTTIAELEHAMSLLEEDPRVDFSTTNNVYTPYGVRSDLHNLGLLNPGLTMAYDRINIEAAWDFIASQYTAPLNSVSIGVIDTGLDANHPEFIGVNRFGIETDQGADSVCVTTKSHGTDVAGIIGANNLSAPSDDNYIQWHMNGILSGIPDVNYSISAYSMSRASESIDLAIHNGAQIINLSYGASACDALPDDSCFKANGFCLKSGFFDNVFNPTETTFERHKKIYEKIFDKYPNVIFVAAAGNATISAEFNSPGGGIQRPNLITVAATELDEDATWASFSNYGNAIDIAAPGEGVYAPSIYEEPLGLEDYRSLYHEEGAFFRGTSAAAPMVSGVVAMLKAIDAKSKLSPHKITGILRATATPPCVAGRNGGCRVNALKAVEYVLGPDTSLQETVLIGVVPGVFTTNGGSFEISVSPKDADGNLITSGVTESNFGFANISVVLSVAPNTEVSGGSAETTGVETVLPAEGEAATLVLTFDGSGSMLSSDPDRLRVVAGKLFVGLLGDGDQAAITDFGVGSTAELRVSRLLQEFTSDKVLLNDAIDQLTVSFRGTPLYDALLDSLDLLGAILAPNPAVVVLTDGEENASVSTLPDVVTQANTQGIPLFTVGLGSGVGFAQLQDLARDTGGAFAEASDADALSIVFENIGFGIVEGRVVVTGQGTFVPPLQQAGEYIVSGELVTTIDGTSTGTPFSFPVDVKEAGSVTGASGSSFYYRIPYTAEEEWQRALEFMYEESIAE